MPTQIHAAGPNGQRSPGLDAAIAGYLVENPPAGGGGASALDDLTDVDTTGQTTGDVLKFNGTTWVADAASAGTVTSTDISDSSAVGRSVLTATNAAAARTAIGAGTSTFSGDYDDLTGKPTLGTAAAAATEDFATAAQGAKADTALQVATAQPINAQTGTTYTLQASDAGKLVTLDNTGAITLNAPGSTFTAGQRVDVLVLNTGMATVVGTSGATGNGTPSLVSRARYSAFTVVWLTATTFVVIGDLASA